jgi:predicted SAM-dependent methyltransferase
MSIKIDIGCGKEPYGNGFLTVDPFLIADIKAFMWKLPFYDNTVDEIYSSHSLEHINKNKVLPTLKEWHRVLKTGGKIILRVPDLIWCCNKFLEKKSDDWYLDILFGNQEHEGEFHKTGFWKERLYKLSEEAGFKVANYEEIESHNQNTLSIELTK